MGHLLRPRSFSRCIKGYSGIIATIFMVLVVMYLYFDVFIFAQNQNVTLQDAVSQSQQLDADRNLEHASILNFTCTSSGGNNYDIVFTVRNAGPIAVQIMRLWAANSQNQYGSQNITLILQPGAEKTSESTINLAGSEAPTVIWLVTQRGNLVSGSPA